ncbi:MAG: FAD-dependent oxidoreductase, partial [Burkholderiales bacterium]|nr:FAD-dependent oxidoreductase [Anaerolineae bacterium]
MNVFDCLIVGGGPAGCSAAITLAQRGLKVALFEAKTYPHHKVCGEFLSPECTPILDTLGMTAALNDLHPITIDTICLTAPDGATWQTALPGALGLSRYALDHALAKQAAVLGVDVREAT